MQRVVFLSRKMAMLSDVSFTKQSHRCLVLIAEPDMETAVSPRKLRVFFIRSSLKNSKPTSP